jgi:hypothetical protein
MRFLLVEEDNKKKDNYLAERGDPQPTNSNKLNEDIWNKAGTIYQPKQDSRYKRLIRKPINTLTQEEIKYIFTIHWCWYLANVRRFDYIEDALENTDDRFREEYFNECYEFFHSLSFPLKVYRAIRDSEHSNDEFTINGKNSSYSWSTNINIYKDDTSKFRNCTKIVSCEIDSNVIDVANTINNFIFYTSSHHGRGYGEYEITLKQHFPQSALKNLHWIDKNEINEKLLSESLHKQSWANESMELNEDISLQDKHSVREFARECIEDGLPFMDYKEFTELLSEQGMTANKDLFQIYTDEYKNMAGGYEGDLEIADKIINEFLKMTTEQIVKLVNIPHRDQIDTNSPMFILPNGTIVSVKEVGENLGYNTSWVHGDLMYIILDTLANNLGLYYPTEMEDAENNLLEHLTDELGWARINCGTTWTEDRFYCVLPDKMTSSQFRSLEKWIEWGYDNHKGDDEVLICFDDTNRVYDFKDNFPEDIIKKIKRYYSSGRLYESVDKNSLLDFIYNNLPLQKNMYWWSTFILPDGNFINLDKISEEYDSDEHQVLFDYLSDNGYNVTETDIVEGLGCIKLNIHYPYIGLSDSVRPTPAQCSTLKTWLRSAESEFGFYSYVKMSNHNMTNPIAVFKQHTDKVYDLEVISPDELVKVIQKSYSSGMLENKRNELKENMDIKPGDRIKMDYYAKPNNGATGTCKGRIGQLCSIEWDDGSKSKEITTYLTKIDDIKESMDITNEVQRAVDNIMKNKSKYRNQDDLESAIYSAVANCFSGMNGVTRDTADMIADVYEKELKRVGITPINEDLNSGAVDVNRFEFTNYRNPDGQSHPKCKTYRSTLEYMASETERLFNKCLKTYWGATEPYKQLTTEYMNLNRHSCTRDLVGAGAEQGLKDAQSAIFKRQGELLELSKQFTEWNGKEWIKSDINEGIDGWDNRTGVIKRIANYLYDNPEAVPPKGYIPRRSREYETVANIYGDYVTTPFGNINTDALMQYARDNKLLDESTNELEQRAKKHKKKSKGMGWHMSMNAGDVEKGIEVFNNSTSLGSSTSGGEGTAMGEAVEKQLYYYDGPIYYRGNKISLSSNIYTTAKSFGEAARNILFKAARGDKELWHYDIVDDEIKQMPQGKLERPKCQQCGYEINDNGDCPVCDYGEDDLLESLSDLEALWTLRNLD